MNDHILFVKRKYHYACLSAPWLRLAVVSAAPRPARFDADVIIRAERGRGCQHNQRYNQKKSYFFYIVLLEMDLLHRKQRIHADNFHRIRTVYVNAYTHCETACKRLDEFSQKVEKSPYYLYIIYLWRIQ